MVEGQGARVRTLLDGWVDNPGRRVVVAHVPRMLAAAGGAELPQVP